MNDNNYQLQNCFQDHREIGPKQNIFFFSEFGPGFPFYGPKGVFIKNQLIKYWRKLHWEENYHEIESPMMLDRILWEKSGHWDLYKENMFISQSDKRDFAIKPMNCPGAILYFQNKKRSEVELPLRVCELGRVHRNEDSGALNGLMRARSFIVDDGHVFCDEKDIEKEVANILALAKRLLNHIGFKNYSLELSVRSGEKKEKYLGKDESWIKAERSLLEAANKAGVAIVRKEGEAKFYGPALDLIIQDNFGRSWQCSSIQLDFNLPSRFNLKYFDSEGKKQVPVLIHRCLFGSLERFLGILIDHYQGKLPLWLLPEQIRLLPISEQFNEESHKIQNKLKESGVRCSIDDSKENLSHKIKKAALDYVPIKLVIGEREFKENLFQIKGHKKKVSINEIISFVKS